VVDEALSGVFHLLFYSSYSGFVGYVFSPQTLHFKLAKDFFCLVVQLALCSTNLPYMSDIFSFENALSDLFLLQ